MAISQPWSPQTCWIFVKLIGLCTMLVFTVMNNIKKIGRKLLLNICSWRVPKKFDGNLYFFQNFFFLGTSKMKFFSYCKFRINLCKITYFVLLFDHDLSVFILPYLGNSFTLAHNIKKLFIHCCSLTVCRCLYVINYWFFSS